MASDDLIQRYLDRLAEQGCTEATLDTCQRVLRLADKRLPFGLDLANEDEVRAYLFRREKPLSPGSRRTYHTVLFCFYEWSVHSLVLRSNPVVAIDPPKTPHYMPRAAEDHQVQWVITSAAEPYRLWATLAAYGNLRCIEVSRLHREHVTAETITVLRGKGDRPRVIPTHALVWAAVQDLPAGPITNWDAREISKRFWKYCNRRNRDGLSGLLSMHRLRGWYASEGYAATNDLLTVSRNMGHKDPRTTAGYIRTTNSQARAVVDGLPTFGLSAAAMTAAPPAGR